MSEISDKQLNANRQNALLGGVKTEDGKEKSKYNALKHGLFSDKVLVDTEDPSELDRLKEQVIDGLKPSNGVEKIFVDRVVANLWRLRRVMDIEKTEILSSFGGMMYDADRVLRYEAMLENSIFKALRELRNYREKADK
jgi:hypothetical protein